MTDSPTPDAANVKLTRSHVPNCKCSIDGDGHNYAPDPTCEEWSKIVRRYIAVREAKAAAKAWDEGYRKGADDDYALNVLGTHEYNSPNPYRELDPPDRSKA